MQASIFVTDDEPALRNALVKRRSRRQHRVRAFQSGDELLAALERDLPDLILLDLTRRIDDEAHDKNFGLPVIDKIFGTAHLPKGRVPTGFGTDSPVPQQGYLRHLAYPFTKQADVAPATYQLASTRRV